MDNLGRLVVERTLSRVWCCVAVAGDMVAGSLTARRFLRRCWRGAERGGESACGLCGVLARQLCPSHIQN